MRGLSQASSIFWLAVRVDFCLSLGLAVLLSSSAGKPSCPSEFLLHTTRGGVGWGTRRVRASKDSEVSGEDSTGDKKLGPSQLLDHREMGWREGGGGGSPPPGEEEAVARQGSAV